MPKQAALLDSIVLVYTKQIELPMADTPVFVCVHHHCHRNRQHTYPYMPKQKDLLDGIALVYTKQLEL